jgi:hypothetical protein
MNNFIRKTDSYKVTHWKFIDPDVQHAYSYFESRGGIFSGTVFFGAQMQPMKHSKRLWDVNGKQKLTLPFPKIPWGFISLICVGLIAATFMAFAISSCECEPSVKSGGYVVMKHSTLTDTLLVRRYIVTDCGEPNKVQLVRKNGSSFTVYETEVNAVRKN